MPFAQVPTWLRFVRPSLPSIAYRLQRRTMSTAEVNQFLVDLRAAIRALEQIDVPTIAGTLDIHGAWTRII